MTRTLQVERQFVVQLELGLHARPAGQFVTLAGRFESEIEVGRGDEWVNGRSVLSLLSLAAARGTRLTIRAVGPDAREAVASLGRIVEAPSPEAAQALVHELGQPEEGVA